MLDFVCVCVCRLALVHRSFENLPRARQCIDRAPPRAPVKGTKKQATGGACADCAASTLSEAPLQRRAAWMGRSRPGVPPGAQFIAAVSLHVAFNQRLPKPVNRVRGALPVVLGTYGASRIVTAEARTIGHDATVTALFYLSTWAYMVLSHVAALRWTTLFRSDSGGGGGGGGGRIVAHACSRARTACCVCARTCVACCVFNAPLAYVHRCLWSRSTR